MMMRGGRRRRKRRKKNTSFHQPAGGFRLCDSPDRSEVRESECWSESADHRAGKVRNGDEKVVKNVKRIKEKKEKELRGTRNCLLTSTNILF